MLKSTVNLLKKIVLSIQNWKISAQRGSKKKISDRPTHVLAPKGQHNIFFFLGLIYTSGVIT